MPLLTAVTLDSLMHYEDHSALTNLTLDSISNISQRQSLEKISLHNCDLRSLGIYRFFNMFKQMELEVCKIPEIELVQCTSPTNVVVMVIAQVKTLERLIIDGCSMVHNARHMEEVMMKIGELVKFLFKQHVQPISFLTS